MSKLCDFYRYCAKGHRCSRRLELDTLNKILRSGRTVKRSDCYSDHPKCFAPKIARNPFIEGKL